MTCRSSHPAASGNNVDTEYLIGGAIDPAYYTQIGAFNGSGIALASESFSGDSNDNIRDSIALYFQYHGGQIRSKHLTSKGQWIGGTESDVIAYDAKNGTPISTVAYSIEDVDTWHVFCKPAMGCCGADRADSGMQISTSKNLSSSEHSLVY